MTNAQEKKLPGDPKLPSTHEELKRLMDYEKGDYTYSVTDYFAKPKVSSLKFSPDGKYFSYREKDSDGKSHIYVKDLATDKITKVLEEGEELIRGYGWINDQRILYVQDQGGNENYQLFAVDLDGKNKKALTPFDSVRVGILNSLKEQPNHIIVQMNKDNPQVFEPYRLNVVTGEMEKLYDNNDPQKPVMGYDFDKDGTLRAITRQVNGTDYEILYRTSPSNDFKLVIKTDWKQEFGILGFDYSSEDSNLAYIKSNIGRDKSAVVLYDLDARKEIKVLYSNETYDAGGMSRSRLRNYEIDYFYYNGEKSEVTPQSKTFKKLHKKLSKKFKGQEFNIVDKTDDETKMLIVTGSDKLYGVYYSYDAKSNKFEKLLDLMPQLKAEDMATMLPISFESRDGYTVYGYITLPQTVEKGQKAPLIVNPHGGPYGVRDSWGFNPETQLFASRGYATLQVNYRGSGGYGKEFYLAGSKQIGRKMLNDLEDGVAYVISKGWVNKDRVAIYGASYGGLATLGSLIRTPDLYRCGIDYVGVSNLFTFVDSFPAYWKPFMKQFYQQWYDPESPEENKIMTEVSPALNATKITKPLFVVQGANDPRVNINESDQIVKTLREKGEEIPYMVKYNEGHGFGHEENRIELYKCMMGFFAEHLKE
ncbi:S9 family peptidase [Prolixibacteraceae bacterium]|nr:S9 family peptidase [Prolixibacteraceae bacterium]